MSEILLSIVLGDPAESIRRLAAALQSITLHSLYIDPARCGTVHTYGERLGAALAQSPISERPQSLASAEESALRQLRGSYAFRAATDPRVSLQTSASLEGWTIICEEDSLFALGCGPRHVYVKPIPASWDEALLYVRPQLQAAAIWPSDEPTIRQLNKTGLGLSRFHPLGSDEAASSK